MLTRTRKPVEKEKSFSGKIEEACARYGFGKNTMRRVAEDAHAVIRVGRCYQVNFEKVDAYLNAIAE